MKPGMFEPRDVKVGVRVGDNVQILSGLLRGDKVAASGGYLIDSEAQLKGNSGHAGMPGMKMEEKGTPVPPAGHEGNTPAAPAPKKNDMNMGDMKM
jgi:Cu(I)/Ag(I) efflux system membrane fusion protein